MEERDETGKNVRQREGERDGKDTRRNKTQGDGEVSRVCWRNQERTTVGSGAGRRMDVGKKERKKEGGKEGKSKEERGAGKGKESPFGSHEILRLATDPRGNDGNRINFTDGRASMLRRLASIRSTDLEVSICRETRNCPATGISSAAFLPVLVVEGSRLRWSSVSSNLRPFPVCFVVPENVVLGPSSQRPRSKYRGRPWQTEEIGATPRIRVLFSALLSRERKEN